MAVAFQPGDFNVVARDCLASCLSESDDSDPLARCMLGFGFFSVLVRLLAFKSACVSNMDVTTRTLIVYAKETTSSLLFSYTLSTY